VLLLATAAVLAVLAVGVAIALLGGDDERAAAADEPVFGPVSVEGTPLPTLTSPETDLAAGQPAPVLTGEAPDGTALTVGGAGDGRPTLVAFLAHWCPHCQRELPVLVDLADDGAFDDVRTVAVLTGSNAAAENFPPTAWLEREGWTGDVLLDDERTTAATAYGFSGYPFLVVLDGDGEVVARTAGEVPGEVVAAMVDAAVAA